MIPAIDRMPLSQDQIDALKNPETMIEIQMENPKNLEAKLLKDSTVTRQPPPFRMLLPRGQIGKTYHQILRRGF